MSFIFLAEGEDIDLVARSNLSKAVVFNSSLISLKTTRTTQGIQLLVSKKGSVMTTVEKLDDVGFKDPEYYRIRKLPAIGYYIKENSFENKQIGLEDLN